MRPIQRVAVLGSGVMGAGIAAHLANCGIPSLLLDRVPPGTGPTADERNGLALAARRNLPKAKPAPLFLVHAIDLITVGNFEDDLHRVTGCDWIIEAVTEDLDVKRALLGAVAKHRRPGSLVSTNTSGISWAPTSSIPRATSSCLS